MSSSSSRNCVFLVVKCPTCHRICCYQTSSILSIPTISSSLNYCLLRRYSSLFLLLSPKIPTQIWGWLRVSLKQNKSRIDIEIVRELGRDRWKTYLIFVLFSPQAQFLNKFFSTQKCVNRDKSEEQISSAILLRFLSLGLEIICIWFLAQREEQYLRCGFKKRLLT